MKDKTTLQLAFRLNELLKQQDELKLSNIKNDHAIEQLDEEWNEICHELWDRIPGLQEDVNLKPKTKTRRKE